MQKRKNFKADISYKSFDPITKLINCKYLQLTYIIHSEIFTILSDKRNFKNVINIDGSLFYY